MTTLEVLRGMRELLSVPERWTRGTSARDSHGRPTLPLSGDAICWCLYGAEAKVCNRVGNDEIYEILNRLQPQASCWQDADERPHAEVLELLDKAIQSATAEQGGEGGR